MQWLISISVAVLMSGASYLTWLQSRKHVRTDQAKILTGIALSLIEPLQVRVDALEDKVEALEVWGSRLTNQVIDLGGNPIPFSFVEEELKVGKEYGINQN